MAIQWLLVPPPAPRKPLSGPERSIAAPERSAPLFPFGYSARRSHALERLLHSFLRAVQACSDPTWIALSAEDIVSKRLGSAYNSGLSHAWVKVKNPDAVARQRERAARWNR